MIFRATLKAATQLHEENQNLRKEVEGLAVQMGTWAHAIEQFKGQVCGDWKNGRVNLKLAC